MEPEDLDMLYGIENDSEVWDVGDNNVPYSRYILHDYIAHAQADIYVDRQVRMVIVNAEGTAVGVVDVVNFSPAALVISPAWTLLARSAIFSCCAT